MLKSRMYHIQTLLLPVTLALGIAYLTHAALPPPSFLPGQPMIVGQQVLLMWMPVPAAMLYHVYLNGNRVATLTANQYLAPLPEDPGEHRYQISAADRSGVEGVRSEPGVIRVRRMTSPKNLVARPDSGSNSIGLVWDKAAGAMIYNVYRTQEGEERQLVASVQVQSYKDGNIQRGVRYVYVVTAKDISGMESPPSEPVDASFTGRAARTDEKLIFRALPTVEEFAVESISDVKLSQVSYLGLGPQGRIWLVMPKTRQIHALDSQGDPVVTFGPYTFDETGLTFLPHKLDFGPDGNLYVSDAFNSTLAAIDPAGSFLWARGILTPAPPLDYIWANFPEHMKSLPTTPSSVLCLEEEIWVTDQRFQIIYRFDYEGNLLGYTTAYFHEDVKVRFPGVGELARVGEDLFLVTFPLSHTAAVVDREFRLKAELGADVRGYTGGFVGIHGVQPWPDNRVLITDPAVGTLQVFDVATGRYLHHIAGPDPRRDPRYRERADLATRKPNMAVRDDRDRIWVYDAGAARIVVLRIAGRVTPPLEGD